MTTFFRRVRAEDEIATVQLDAQLHRDLVAGFTLALSDAEQENLLALPKGTSKATPNSNPAEAYGFSILDRQVVSLPPVKEGSLLKGLLYGLGRKDWTEFPKIRTPAEISLVIDCDPRVMTWIDRVLIEHPYVLLENGVIAGAHYSFATVRELSTHSSDGLYVGSRTANLRELLQSAAEGVDFSVEIAIGSEYNSRDSFTVRGTATGTPRAVLNAKLKLERVLTNSNFALQNSTILYDRK